MTFGSMLIKLKILETRGDNGKEFSITDLMARVCALISIANELERIRAERVRLID